MERSQSYIDNGHRDYSTLLCYQKAVVIYDLTYLFCSRYIDKKDRTYDQMIQAARSGKQNIVEGYADAPTSYEMALKLYNIALGSLMELLEDYKDYLRTRGLQRWKIESKENKAMRQIGKQQYDSSYYLDIAKSRTDEVIANMVIVLIHQESIILKNFISSEIERFAKEGGFREKLTRIRLDNRNRRQ